jgi:hypothetical protein
MDNQRKAFEETAVIPKDVAFDEKSETYRWLNFPAVDAPFNNDWFSFQDGWQAATKQAEQECKDKIAKINRSNDADIKARDNKIESLQAENEDLIDQNNMAVGGLIGTDVEIANLKAEIEQLKNPWISVEDERPRYGRPVLLKLEGVVSEHVWMMDGADNEADWFEYLRDPIDSESFFVYSCSASTEWMPLP